MKNELLLTILEEISKLQSMRAWRIDKILVSHDIFNGHIAWGASKFCLILPDVDFVIKWDNNAESSDSLKEVEVYKDAVNCNLDYFFPKTEEYAEFNGYIFIKQEKIDYPADKVNWKDTCRYKKIARTVSPKIIQKMNNEIQIAEYSDYSRVLDNLWAGVVISLYGKAQAKALCDFIRKHSITDLHRSNIGYKNHRPIILDFCGYYGG